MFTVADARKMILDETRPLAAARVVLADAGGCVLTEDVVAPIALPSWDNSAVDGYAVRAMDVAAASENNPIHLGILGEQAAGSSGASQVLEQHCIRIFTGAPIPAGADAVVMQEDTRPHHAGYVAVVEGVEAGEHIRRAGEDVAAGAVVLRAGTVVGSAHVAMAAAVGLNRLAVHPRPRVGVLATGAELVEPGTRLQPGQIYNSNSPLLCSLAKQAGCDVIDLGIADDSKDALQEKIDYGLSECDVVITAGGVSVGEHDLVKEVLVDLGCQQRFWQVSMKPGKPFVFATRAPKMVFGLPGNPVSAAVTFLVLVRPSLMRLRGFETVDLPRVSAVAAADFVNRGERVHYMRAKLEQSSASDGWTVRPLPRQGSHVISSLTEADCLVEVPACRTISAGTEVPALRIE